jgi:hypothetical protein
MSKMLFTACSQSYDFKLQRSSSIVRFEVKNIFLDFEKRSSLLGMYNAGDVVVLNSKVVGLAPVYFITVPLLYIDY